MFKKVAFVGTEKSGKSTLASRIAGKDYLPGEAALNVNFRTFKKDNDSLTIWDIKGKASLGKDAANYLSSLGTIVFVVSSEANAYKEGSSEEAQLKKIIENVKKYSPSIKEIHIVFSKDDLPENQKIAPKKKEELVKIIKDGFQLAPSVSISISACSAKSNIDIDKIVKNMLPKPPTVEEERAKIGRARAKILVRGIVLAVIISTLLVAACFMFPPAALFLGAFFKLGGIKLAMMLLGISYTAGAAVASSYAVLKNIPGENAHIEKAASHPVSTPFNTPSAIEVPIISDNRKVNSDKNSKNTEDRPINNASVEKAGSQQTSSHVTPPPQTAIGRSITPASKEARAPQNPNFKK